MEATPAYQESLREITAGKYFFLAGISLLIYDHILTFPEEVEVIWKRKKTYLSWLFLLVRYYAPLAMVVVFFGYFSTEMTRERCTKWMLFLPLGITVPLSLLPSLLMSVRVWAMYTGNRLLLAFLLLYLAAQTAAGLWQYTVPGGMPAPDPVDNYQYHFCIYLPPKKIGHISILYVSMEVAFDSLTFLLTVSRTVYLHFYHGGQYAKSGRNTSTSLRRISLLESLIKDGALYFAAIFSINLAWIIMILHAPTGLRAIASQPSACLMTTIICRITMNLRTTAYHAQQPHPTGTDAGIPLSRLRPAVRVSAARSGRQDDAFGRIAVGDGYTTSSREGDLVIEKPFANGNGYGDYAAYQHAYGRVIRVGQDS